MLTKNKYDLYPDTYRYQQCRLETTTSPNLMQIVYIPLDYAKVGYRITLPNYRQTWEVKEVFGMPEWRTILDPDTIYDCW